MNAAKSLSFLMGMVVLAMAMVTPSAAAETGAWELRGSEQSKEVPDSEGDCYNSQEVTVGELSATTYARCTWPSPAIDAWSRSQHSWSAAPPARLAAGEQWQITSTTSVEGTYLSAALTGGGSTWVRIDLVPGGGPYPGTGWASATEENTPASAVSEFTIPAGGGGSVMLVALSFQGPGGSGATTYTYEWQGSAGTDTPPLPATEAPSTSVATPSAEPEEPEPCSDDVKDSGARFSSISGEVEVFPESDPDAIYTAKSNSVLLLCDHVLTGGNGRATIMFGDMSAILVLPESEIVIISPRLRSPSLDVRKGSLWLRFKAAILGDAIEVKSNLAATGINGTTIVLEVADGADVLKVIEGDVEFTSLTTGETAMVAGGETVTATSAGLSDKTTFDVAAESQAWEQDLAAVSEGGSDLAPLGLIAGVVLVAALGGWYAVSQRRNRAAITTASSGSPMSSATVASPAGWFPDPNGVHEYRYWDGSVWTANVSDAGRTSTDLL